MCWWVVYSFLFPRDDSGLHAREMFRNSVEKPVLSMMLPTYHYVPICNERLFSMIQSKSTLCIGTEW